MKLYIPIAAALIIALPSCKKDEPNQPASSPELPEIVEPLVNPEPPSQHLGFASHTPADVDLFVAGYGADEMIRTTLEGLTKTFLDVQTQIQEEGDTEPDISPATEEGKTAWIDEAIPYFGDEAFVFVGQGPGELVEVATSTYRDLSAASLGLTVKLLLDAADDGDPLKAMEGDDELLQNLLDKTFQAIQKDSSLAFPTIVTGWKPHSSKKDECVETLIEMLDAIMVESPTMKPISFEASGVSMNGYQGSGGEMFADLILEARQAIEDAAQTEQVDQLLSDERVEELMTSLENFEFTITLGSLDDYVVIYLGDGSDGFQLAESPSDSLASTSSLTWTNPFADKTIASFAYASDSFVKSWLPLIDSGPYWNAIAQSLPTANDESRAIQELLEGIAGTEHQLAERQTSAWSGIVVLEEGLRFESRGGWANPGIDYTTPLQLTEAANATNPAIRAHWIQNRSRNNLEWSRIEQFGSLIQLGFDAFQDSDYSQSMEVPEEMANQLMGLVEHLNSSYRDDFRNGIGDEQAFVLDFHGMTPPIPGIPEDIVSELELPRFLYARPVTDREKLAVSSENFVKGSHEVITMATEAIDFQLPLLEPQLIESNELDTWYYPLPISGGDFIPGVSINDQLWMVGTSRSMAKSFASAPASSGNEAGVIIDIDFEAIGQWFSNTYRLTKDQADQLSDQAPDMAKNLATEENLESVSQEFSKLKAFHYRHWMADAVPRSSYHLHIAPMSTEEE